MIIETRPTVVARQVLGITLLAAGLTCAAGEWAAVSAADLCISMTDSQGQVAGLQLELKWNGACMSADAGRGTSAKCSADPATGKQVQTRVMPGPTLKAIFVSLSNTSPIPDGNLFCCSFAHAAGQEGSCCGLSIGNTLGSDPQGVATHDFTLLASMDGNACTASETGGSQAPPPARGPLQREPAYQPPPVVSVPGAAEPQAPQGAPASGGGAAPVVPGHVAPRAPVGGMPAGAPAPVMEAPPQPRAVGAGEEPREAPATPAATLRPWPTPRRTPRAVTVATPKARATLGTPAAARKTPSPARSVVPAGTKTPRTPAPTAKASKKKRAKAKAAAKAKSTPKKKSP